VAEEITETQPLALAETAEVVPEELRTMPEVLESQIVAEAAEAAEIILPDTPEDPVWLLFVT
jgi:hypothetical protein